MKKCSKCELVKPLDCFYKNKRNADGLQYECVECRLEDEKARYRKNPSKYTKRSMAWRRKNPERNKEYFLLRHYGLTFEKYKQMLDSQNGVCAICGKSGGKRMLAVDHVKNSNPVKIRGILCRGCNTGIGNLCHDVGLLKKAIQYLEEKR